MMLIISTRKITFDNKKEVFLHLLKKDKTGFREKYPTLNADLKDIIEERDRVAHYVLSTNKDEIENYDGVVKLANFKNEMEFVKYDDNRIGELNEKIQKYISAIRDLVNS